MSGVELAGVGFLGIDAGTQGLTVALTDEDLKVIATGDGHYEMVAGLPEGCYEQNPADWESALATAMNDMRGKLSGSTKKLDVRAIGISGQMHGEVLVDQQSQLLGPARLWCDSRNEKEGHELTHNLKIKMPKRLTASRWLWTVRNKPALAKKTARITTPAGWLSHRLTSHWNLGIGDASGMFPIDPIGLQYDQQKLDRFDHLVSSVDIRSLSQLLPTVRVAGEDGGTLNAEAATLLGLRKGIPVAPAEGDQPAALAGSMIGDAGMVSVSFGTSVCANSVGDHAFDGVCDGVDHFCAVDGKPINMIFLRNGTSFMNTVVQMFADATEEISDSFDDMMRKVITADLDCGGVMALPFMDDEPGLGISQGGSAAICGLNTLNAKPGNVVKAVLLATMFNLKMGVEILDQQQFPRTQLVLTGGLTKTPELGQLLADVMQTTVMLPPGSDEGTAIGSALMAKYRYCVIKGLAGSWADFLREHSKNNSRRFEPDAGKKETYNRLFDNYRLLVKRFFGRGHVT